MCWSYCHTVKAFDSRTVGLGSNHYRRCRLFPCPFFMKNKHNHLAPVVQRSDNAIQGLNLYQVENAIRFVNTYQAVVGRVPG